MRNIGWCCSCWQWQRGHYCLCDTWHTYLVWTWDCCADDYYRVASEGPPEQADFFECPDLRKIFCAAYPLTQHQLAAKGIMPWNAHNHIEHLTAHQLAFVDVKVSLICAAIFAILLCLVLNSCCMYVSLVAKTIAHMWQFTMSEFMNTCYVLLQLLVVASNTTLLLLIHMIYVAGQVFVEWRTFYS